MLQPGKCLFPVFHPQVGIYKSASRNIAFLPALLQFVEEPKCIFATPGMSVRPDEHTYDTGATVGDGNRLLQNRNCILGLTFGDERETEIPKGTCRVRLHCQ